MAKNWVPVEPANKKLFEMLGISINPKDIPKVKLDEPITVKKWKEILAAKEAEIKAVEDKYK